MCYTWFFNVIILVFRYMQPSKVYKQKGGWKYSDNTLKPHRHRLELYCGLEEVQVIDSVQISIHISYPLCKPKTLHNLKAL